MFRIIFKSSTVFLLISSIFISCSQKKDATMKLHQIFDSYWEHRLKSDPTFATYIGDHRYDDKLADYSESAFNQQIETFKDFLAQSEKINQEERNGAMNK